MEGGEENKKTQAVTVVEGELILWLVESARTVPCWFHCQYPSQRYFTTLTFCSTKHTNNTLDNGINTTNAVFLFFSPVVQLTKRHSLISAALNSWSPFQHNRYCFCNIHFLPDISGFEVLSLAPRMCFLGKNKKKTLRLGYQTGHPRGNFLWPTMF